MYQQISMRSVTGWPAVGVVAILLPPHALIVLWKDLPYAYTIGPALCAGRMNSRRFQESLYVMQADQADRNYKAKSVPSSSCAV
jgi:hypothetical protein